MFTPLTVNIMLACHVSKDPDDVVGTKVWHSIAAKEERGLLVNEGMLELENGDWIVTDRGKVWIERILSTPLPTCVWTFPDD
ncbi:hypothetical protein [uncultured Martelella sp.]|uniref:hypothetical protein n=1 Tax=uncultured Martelella sp. TaxID=392331 RepID=UPI0029C8494A|nr:hypothetical protein [uncultured Martelella sp.]